MPRRIITGMIIGLLTDTHLPNMIRQLEELGPQPAEFFSSVDLILHGGDLTAPYVLDWLEQFAPVLCSTGNNDPIPDARCEDVQVIDVEGWRVGMTHSLGGQFRPMSTLQRYFPSPVDVMIAGHTHEERLEHRDGVTLVNSGSITFPHHKELRLGTVGLLELTANHLDARVFPLGYTQGRPNPGREIGLKIHRNGDGHVKVQAADSSPHVVQE